MSFDTLLCGISDRVATITINRPDKLNALNAACKAELLRLLETLRGDPSVHAVILTGSGAKAFMAGTDIAELARLDPVSGKEFAGWGQSLFDSIQHLGKPVIAAVNGYALGGGCELALACHIRVAADSAKFGQPEVNLGIIPGYGGTQRLARIVGYARAAEMILTGRQVDAQEALRIGLVNSVVPAAELMAHAGTIAAAIADKGMLAVRMALKSLNAVFELPLSEGLRVEAGLFGELCGTGDFREGTAAFLEKRKPAFRDS
ncbi:MAG TPA: enoyl-CoA hydratase-related protein [Bacteroidota bacterium]|nr:enoyl-CoA hydratase-related protein [Bacteroidota bacterium]